MQAAQLLDVPLPPLDIFFLFVRDLLDELLPLLRAVRRVGWDSLSCSLAQAIVSALPPSTISVPRPAMFVAIVTAPSGPA